MSSHLPTIDNYGSRENIENAKTVTYGNMSKCDQFGTTIGNNCEPGNPHLLGIHEKLRNIVISYEGFRQHALLSLVRQMYFRLGVCAGYRKNMMNREHHVAKYEKQWEAKSSNDRL